MFPRITIDKYIARRKLIKGYQQYQDLREVDKFGNGGWLCSLCVTFEAFRCLPVDDAK